MTLATIEKLCCPFDKADLQLTVVSKDLNEHIIEGIFYCSSCHRQYPIIRGVPIMNPDEYREPALEQPVVNRWLSNS